MTWTGKKVLVTGAAGFIGSHLTEQLVAQGANVRAFVKYNSRNDHGLLRSLPQAARESVEVVTGDLRDGESVRRAIRGCDTVFHLAALVGIPYSYVNPLDYVLTNVLGTTNVLNACRDHEVRRLVHTSTSETYGSAIEVPIPETHPLQPQSPYSASKIGADSLALSYYYSFELPVAVIRPFNTYGPRQSLRAIIPTVIAQAQVGAKLKLGNLDTTRDFLFVEDTVRAFLTMGENDAAIGQTVNFGTGVETSIRDLIASVGRVLQRELSIEVQQQRIRPEASEVMRLCADFSLAKKLFAWQAQVSLDQGITETARWMAKASLGNDVFEYVL